VLLPLPWSTCQVPRDLAPISSRRTAAEVPPASVQVAADAPERIWRAVENLYRTGIHPAIALCIRRHGEVLLDRAIGHARGNGPGESPSHPKQLATVDSPFNVFSAAKAVTAMLVHHLDEANLIRLDDPICEYIPEFATGGKQLITIRHLLSHRAGIPTVPADVMRLEYLERPDEIIRILCATRPETRPGSRLAYHAITGGFVLGEVLRRVTGMTVRTYMDRFVRQPLGFRWMQYGTEPRDVREVAHSYVTGPTPLPPISTLMQRALGLPLGQVVALSNDPRFLTAEVPSGVLITTANEMSRFYQLLLNGGRLDGESVFAARTVRRAIGEQSYLEPDLTLGLPIRYSLGFMLGARYVSLYGPDTADAFGHLGFSNVISWADPARQIAGTLLTSGKPIVYCGLIQLWNLLSTINTVCPRTTARRRSE
jgi:CubicO group peptidase (beta-lactamase class C family)